LEKLSTNGDLKRLIKENLGIVDASIITESFVAQPKQFDIKTEKLSQQTKDSHIALYKNYVEKFNKLSATLDTADRSAAGTTCSEYRFLKEDEAYTLNAIYLHELYFANIGDQNSVLYSDTISHMRLDRDFGGIKNWQEDFIAAAMSAREGWVICCLNTFLKRYINVVIDGDSQGIPLGCFPIIVLDMWSHSYFRDYLTDKKKYIRDMMGELNWKIIDDRFTRAEHVLDALK